MNERRRTRRWLSISVVLLWCFAFSGELAALLGALATPPNAPPRQDTLFALLLLIFELSIYILLCWFALAAVSQFVLPVQTRAERRRVLNRLKLHATGRHGPALFVKDGRLIASHEERQHLTKGPGVALIDAVSALALEKDNHPSETQPWRGFEKRSWLAAKVRRAARTTRNPLWSALHIAVLIFPRKFRQTLLALGVVRPRPLNRPPRVARVQGPGLVFTDADERIRASLDLRVQSRTKNRIKALTRDGIEVRATIIVKFILDGRPPARQPANPNRERSDPAFPFDPHNAFQAVYGSPVSSVRRPDVEDDDAPESVQDWTDLPAFVAVEVYRDMMSTETLDNLFRPTTETDLPYLRFVAAFNERVVNERVLSERGIRMLRATIGQLTLPDEVRQQRLQTWRAEWERQAVETLAAGDLQAQRIVARERAKAQFDMTRQMMDAMRGGGNRTAIMLRLLQVLESASADPSVRRLMPDNTISLLNGWLDNLRAWFAPEKGQA